MKSNPAWVTDVLAEHYDFLANKVSPQWMPKLSDVTSRRGAFTAKITEYGCGAYGCVVPTLADNVVLKVTTDETEAQFAARYSNELVAPVCVTYHVVVSVSNRHEDRPVYFLWREAAHDVGNIVPVMGQRADDLIHAQHQAAQRVYLLMARRVIGPELDAELEEWRAALMAMADVPQLEPLATGMATIWDQQRIFFGDVHAGNIGMVARDRDASRDPWVIVDPGNVAVLQ